MEKEHIIEQCMVSANLALQALNSGTELDLNSLALWTESLARYVLNSKKQHPAKKHLLDIVSNLYQTTRALTDEHKLKAIQFLQDYIRSVCSATRCVDWDQKLTWEPPIRDDGGRNSFR